MASSASDKPLSINEYAYEQIKQRIQSGYYSPGEKLQTQNIANDLNISRTPVVVAINRLADEGYATSIPQQGVYVRKFTYKSIRDILELRRMIELYSAEAIIDNLRFDKSSLDELKKIVEGYKELENNSSYSRATEIECRFHHALIALSGNDEILRVYRSSLCVEAAYIMYSMADMPLTQVQNEYKEHAEIIALLEKGDYQALRSTLDRQIQTPLSMLSWLVNTGRIKD